MFFALWPDAGVRAALAHATHKAVRACGGRPVPEQKLHATLVFLGSVPESRIPELLTLGAGVAANIPAEHGSAPELVFDRIQCWGRSGVLVAATGTSIGPGQKLAGALADSLQRETSRIGLTPDLKPFRAHITLARKVGRPARPLSMQPVTWSLSEFALVESRTEPSGPVYTVLQTFPLRFTA